MLPTTNYLRTVLLMAGILCSNAKAQLILEPAIPAEEVARIEQVAKEARDDATVTQIQYETTIRMVHSSPCRQVERALGEEEKTLLSAVIAAQHGWEKVDVLQKFQLGTWQIIYVGNHVTDDPYLFFPDNPQQSKSLGMWGGAATIFETSSVYDWVISEIPGIPEQLAECFAWHVTLNRD